MKLIEPNLPSDLFSGVAGVHPISDVRALAQGAWELAYHDGEKYPGGYGPTQILSVDYWTLRARSHELFEKNLYARALIRRLVVNEINTGLHLEAIPYERILGFEEGGLEEWTEETESRFEIWASTPAICDQQGARTFGDIQAQARLEALVGGDVLIVLGQDPTTKLPTVRLIRGDRVVTPVHKPKNGNEIIHGVELDPEGRQVGYWVQQKDGTPKRYPAFGEQSGRRIAWLYYGTDRRLDDVRGQPILSLILQNLKELDRYRDAALRKAILNSLLAIFIKKTNQGPSFGAITGSAVEVGDELGLPGGSAEKARNWRSAKFLPGTIVEALEDGEEPQPVPTTGTDEKFGAFEEAVIAAVAMAQGIPPEIYRLAFSNNYSASQAAINEFKLYLNQIRTAFGTQVCQPIYTEWLISEVLNRRIKAARLLEAWRDPLQYDVFGAWVASDWSGQIKPATDLLKQANGYAKMVEEGFITRDRSSRETSGMKFSRVVRTLERENKMLARALEALSAANKKAAALVPPPGGREDEEENPDDEDKDESESEDEDQEEKAA